MEDGLEGIRLVFIVPRDPGESIGCFSTEGVRVEIDGGEVVLRFPYGRFSLHERQSHCPLPSWRILNDN